MSHQERDKNRIRKGSTVLVKCNDDPEDGLGNLELPFCKILEGELNQHGTKTKSVLDDCLKMQSRQSYKDGWKEDIRSSGECRKRKGRMLDQKLRHRMFKEKMEALQELVPDCNKMEEWSTIDDAITYIKALRYQVQVMLTAGSGPLGRSYLPLMMPQPGQQETDAIPKRVPLMMPQPGVGMVSGFGLARVPMCVLGLPATSSLASNVQYRGDFSGSLPLATCTLVGETNQYMKNEDSDCETNKSEDSVSISTTR